MGQYLSPKAAKDKKARDLAFAKTFGRKKKKAFNQAWHRKHPEADGMDYDHKDGKAKTIHANRGNDGNGTKNEG